MLRRLIPLFLILLLVSTQVAYANEDPKAGVFESNIDSWTFAGDGSFGQKSNYYGASGKFMSDQTVQYVYAISKMEITGDKSFTFEVEFDVPNYDVNGAENGWCWQNVLFGVQYPEEPGADNLGSLRFTHYPEGGENIQLSSAFSGYSESVPMPDEKLNDMSHTVLIYYSVIDDSLTVTVDGEEMFKFYDAKEDVKGHLGFGATWCTMRVLKAVYTELDETPAPVTPTPIPEDTPSPPKTKKPTATPKAEIKETDPAKIVAFTLGSIALVLAIVVVVVAIKKRK